MKTILLLCALASCQQAPSKLDDFAGSAVAPSAHPQQRVDVGSAAGSKTIVEAQDIDSHDILDRKDTFPEVSVKHILLAWKELDQTTYHGRIDKRAKDRTNAEAAKLAQEYLAELKADPSKIDAMVKEHSEDPGAMSGDPYVVKTDTAFVPEFKKLALRLKEKEAGIVKTTFGYHVIERVAPPPPDPLESADILKREPPEAKVKVKHILLGWKDAHTSDPRGTARSRADLEKLVKDTVAKLQKGDKIEPLMKELSEDPGSQDGKDYEVTPTAGMVPPFTNLSLRLKVGEVGVVKTDFGIHIIKRVE